MVEAAVADCFDGAVKDGSDARCSGLRHCRSGWQWRENLRGVLGVLELGMGYSSPNTSKLGPLLFLMGFMCCYFFSTKNFHLQLSHSPVKRNLTLLGQIVTHSLR